MTTGGGTPGGPRRARLFVRALWDRDLVLQADGEAESPWLAGDVLHVPLAWQGHERATALYRAAACHAAAHGVYGSAPMDVGDLRPRQRVLIGLIEDARVEALAIGRFPGLRRLWRRWHATAFPDTQHFPVLMRRLARVLLDDTLDDGNAWVQKGARLFHGQRHRWHEASLARDIGLQLAHDLGQMRIPMDDGRAFQIAAYRDDNRHLWQQADAVMSADGEGEVTEPEAASEAFLSEADEGRLLELADAPGGAAGPSSAWQLQVREDDAVLEFRHPGTAHEPVTRTYPEWDYRLQLARSNWCTVREWPAPLGDMAWVRSAVHRHSAVLARLQRIAQAFRLEKVQRVRRQHDGDEVDLDAALHALADLRHGREPDPRVHTRLRPLHDRGLASLVLLDLSESGNDPMPGSDRTVVDLTREAALLLGHTLQTLGETFAIHGFRSNGRHDVGYCRLKDFSDPFDDQAMRRIAGIQAAYSTRLGAALRHGVAQLMQREEGRRLLVVVTDGSPSDIDVYDPDYLSWDVQRAVREARAEGVEVFCLNLDAAAHAGLPRLFGAGRVRALDDVRRLPEVLPQLLLALLRRY